MKSNTARLGVWVALLAIGISAGLYGLAQMLTKGQGETLGTSDQVPWGLFIVGYAFFIGTSAGATVIGLMIHAFGREEFRPLGITALLVTLLSLMAAMSFIALDVGHVGRMLLIPWVLANPSSLFLYTAVTYYIFALVLLGQLYFTIKMTRGSSSHLDRRMAKWTAIAAVPVAFWLQGALFAVVKARESWNSPLLPPHSMVAGLVSGIAVVIMIAVVTSFLSKKPLVSRAALEHLGKLMALFVAAALVFDLVDAAVTIYSNTTEGAETWKLLTGRFLGLYALNLGGLAVALILLLSRWGQAASRLLVASFIAVLAIAAYRYNVVVVGQLVPLWPGETGPVLNYSPSDVELSLAVGVVALILLAYTVLTKVLSAREAAGPIGRRTQGPALASESK